MSPSQTVANFMVTGLRQIKTKETQASADLIADSIENLCLSLKSLHEVCVSVTNKSGELVYAGADLIEHFNDETWEQFLYVFDNLNSELQKVIESTNDTREKMGAWWNCQEEATQKWFFLNGLQPIVVHGRNWHLDTLSELIGGLTMSHRGLTDIRVSFASSPIEMTRRILSGRQYLSEIREGFACNEAFALGWWVAFENEKQLICKK